MENAKHVVERGWELHEKVNDPPAPVVKKLVTVVGQFTKIGQLIELAIPNGAEEVAFRLQREGGLIQIEIVFVVEKEMGTHVRAFLALGGDILPETFVKYIGTLPLGYGGPVVHVIETRI